MNQSRSVDPLYAGPRQGQAAQMSTNQQSTLQSRTNGPAQETTDTNAARAARYEDEKRRIIESCFAKRDPDGVQSESYITHVRVIEDAAYPSSPPPPDSSSSNKKQRVIMVAVRRSGKVRVHKARENPNGTFSIGKTWNLDELTDVQTYTSLTASNPQEQRDKQWAGPEGFTASLGKPYFWLAPTAKEKDFFIASLVKIYKKYTGGKLPNLIGFAPHEIELLSGGPPAQQNPPSRAQPLQAPQVVSPSPLPTEAQPQTAWSKSQDAAQSSPTFNRDTTGADRSDRDNQYNRQDYRFGPREAQQPPPIVQEPIRPSGRIEPPERRDDLRYAHPQDRGVRQDQYPARAPGAAADYLKPPSASQMRTVSPQPSQSSIYMDQNRDPHAQATITNGHFSSNATSTDTSRRPYNEASASRGSSDQKPSQDFRPNASAAPEQRPTETGGQRGRLFYNEALAGPRKQSIPRSEKSLGGHSQHSADLTASGFHTPLTFPTATPIGEKRSISPLREPLSPEIPTSVPAVEVEKAGQYEHAKPVVSAEVIPPAIPPIPSPVPSEPQTGSDTTPRESSERITPTGEPTEEFRPGLGPMIKKKSAKDIAGQFRKAAMAASAFQPRQGGGAARLKALQATPSEGPDGITSVVPAPSLRGMSADSSRSGTPDVITPGVEKDLSLPTGKAPEASKPQTDPTLPETPVVDGDKSSTDEVAETDERMPDDDQGRARSPTRKRRQRQEAEMERFCAPIGVDIRIFESRGLDFCDLLAEFGWEGRLPEKQKIESFEADIRREIGRAQATGWLGHVDQQETKVAELSKAFDNAIAECEELDGLLTLYAHELNTLQEDIEFIEAQSQGLQVQTVNQKLLQVELQGLLKNLTLTSHDLRPLRGAPIDSKEGIQAIEQSLALLYKAVLTIDPDIQQMRMRKAVPAANQRVRGSVYAETDTGQMLAVRQKKDQYREETMNFMRRFNLHMTSIFQSADANAADDYGPTQPPPLQLIRNDLWVYNAMMLFVREVNTYEWQTLISSYEMSVKQTYTEQFRDSTATQMRGAREISPDEMDYLFTVMEKEKPEESLATTAARKLTVRNKNAAKRSALRGSVGGKTEGVEPWEVVDATILQQSKTISEEQNFVVQFFHLNSQSNVDFVEAISGTPPVYRRLPNLNARMAYDPDRDMAKIVQQVTDGIFGFWETEMHGLIDWATRPDQIQAVGIMCSLEQCMATYEETNQEFVTRTLKSLHERSQTAFQKFIDDQVRAIEETKIKLKKRKGVVSFMRVFPIFSANVESMIPTDMAANEILDVRFLVNDAYLKILTAMWESLAYVAKDSPTSAAGSLLASVPGAHYAVTDTEDKGALNYNIMHIENFNFFIDEVEIRHNLVLQDWQNRARADLSNHLSQYVDVVIRRPLGKWLDFVESTEALMNNTDLMNPITNRPSHSKNSVKKVLAAYDVKEVKKGIETLKKRIERHFAEAEDQANANRALVARIFELCGSRYANAHDRMRTIVEKVYENQVEFEWRKEEMTPLFKK